MNEKRLLHGYIPGNYRAEHRYGNLRSTSYVWNSLELHFICQLIDLSPQDIGTNIASMWIPTMFWWKLKSNRSWNCSNRRGLKCWDPCLSNEPNCTYVWWCRPLVAIWNRKTFFSSPSNHSMNVSTVFLRVLVSWCCIMDGFIFIHSQIVKGC